VNFQLLEVELLKQTKHEAQHQCASAVHIETVFRRRLNARRSKGFGSVFMGCQ
jgi:hypothetical protein